MGFILRKEKDMKKLTILAIILILVWLLKPVKQENVTEYMADRCARDMSIYEELICD